MRCQMMGWTIYIGRKPTLPTETLVVGKEAERKIRQDIVDDLARLVEERKANRKGKMTQIDDAIIQIMYRIAKRDYVAELLVSKGLN